MAAKWLLVFSMVWVFFWGSASSGNVLIWPADDSHWINLKFIMNELTARGHRVTVLLPSFFRIIDPSEPSPFQMEVIPTPFSKAEMEDLLHDYIHLCTYGIRELSSWEFFSKLDALVTNVMDRYKTVCHIAVTNEKLLEKMESAGFDVLLSDPLIPCAELLAQKLRIPFIYTYRFSFGNTVERLCGCMPAPPSYVPASTGELTDRMSFMERVRNLLFYLFQDFLFQHVQYKGWDKFYSDVLGRPTTLCEVMGKAEIWLIRTYWDFEFPRPFLPNFEFVGGLHCQPAKPLPEKLGTCGPPDVGGLQMLDPLLYLEEVSHFPVSMAMTNLDSILKSKDITLPTKEMEKFVQSSGEHGIVVFSLGSMIKNLTEEKGNMIALALSQLPQKVLWRYKGKRPDTLGANTRLYDWIPQNDLLGHPKTKAFITHGGTNGIYEAIYHGVPMVGIPMFADQPDNVVHMKAKGMAVQLDIHTMKTEDLVDAVNTVIHNATYKENALRLSQIHHDQPIKPLDRAVFWIEFVMRHKGAKHLRAAAHHLTWYQYHSLDVIAFLIGCMAVFIFIAVKCCSFFCRKCGRIIRKTKTE